MWNYITSKRHIFYPFISLPLFFSFLWNKTSFTGRGKILGALCLELNVFTSGLYCDACHFVRSCDFVHIVLSLYLNPLKTKRRLLYLNTQFVPRSKHF